MFKRLRNRFLLLNLSIISIVMVGAFVTIYLTTYSSIQSENKDRIDNGGIHFEQRMNEEKTLIEEPDVISKGTTNRQVTIRQISPKDSPSFHIFVDKNGEFINAQSFLDMPDEAYQKAAEMAWKKPKNYSVITLEGRDWMYAIKPVEYIQLYERNGNTLYTNQRNGSYQIAFLDVTDSNHTLFTLFTIFLIVGFIMLLVILVISLYFANRAISPIEAAWEKQKQFIADASHELKTPLTILHSNYDVLVANKEDTIENQIKWLDYIKIGTDRMSRLIGDLLSLAKMDEVTKIEQAETVNVSKITLDAIESLEASIVGKDIKLTTSIEQDVVIQCDLEKISQIFSILLDNAVKYTNPNGWIQVFLTKSKHGMSFSVKNSGKGIPKEDLPKVFDRFYRVDASRTSENGGYGLGLSIAKTIADNLKGKLTVTSVENESTRFIFFLKT